MLRILENLCLSYKDEIKGLYTTKQLSLHKHRTFKSSLILAVIVSALILFGVRAMTYAAEDDANFFVTRDETEGSIIKPVENDSTETKDELTGAEKFIQNTMLGTILSTEEEDAFMAPATLLKNSYGYLNYAMTGDGGDTTMDGAADFEGLTNLDFYKYIQGFSLILMFTLFFYEQSEEYIGNFGDVSVEKIIRPYLKLILAVFFIFNIQKLLSGFLLLSKVLCESISLSLSSGQITIVDQLKDQLTQEMGFNRGKGLLSNVKNIIPFLSAIIMLAGPYIVAQITNVGMFFVAFRRLLELACLTLFAPFAFFDIYKGANSQALRFIRGYLGICFQAAAIMAVLAVSSIACGVVFQQYFGSIDTKGAVDVSKVAWTMVAIKLAQLTTAVGGTAQITRKIFGGD